MFIFLETEYSVIKKQLNNLNYLKQVVSSLYMKTAASPLNINNNYASYMPRGVVEVILS